MVEFCIYPNYVSARASGERKQQPLSRLPRGEMIWNGVFGLFPCRVLAEATILCIMVSFKALKSILLRL